MRARNQRVRPFDVDDRPLVGHRLARERAVDVLVERQRLVGAHHVGGMTADDLLARKAGEVEERLVDERVAALAVEVDDRLGDVVGEQAQLLLARPRAPARSS